MQRKDKRFDPQLPLAGGVAAALTHRELISDHQQCLDVGGGFRAKQVHYIHTSQAV